MEIPLSVVILAKNQQAQIAECIKSALQWSGEIIVVNDSSQDETSSIAGSLGAKVVSRTLDTIGSQRNWALQQARFEWVLILDPDERLTLPLQKEISEIIEKNPRQDFFNIPRKNFIGNYWMRYGGQYPDLQIKLFRKEKTKFDDVSARLLIPAKSEVGVLENPLARYEYSDFSNWIQSLDQQSTLEALKWIEYYKKDPKKAASRMQLNGAIMRTIERFFRVYFSKQGFKDGVVGFVLAYLSSGSQILTYAKYWEMRKKI